MKNYLELASFSYHIHKRQSRMVRICIFLSVFLITAIFGMADMEIRSQRIQAEWNYGKWHAAFKDMPKEQVDLIAKRPKVLACTRYETLNYRLEENYHVEGKDAMVIGFDESALSIFPVAALSEGNFPKGEREVLADEHMKKSLSLKLLDEVTLNLPDGSGRTYRTVGFAGQIPSLLKADAYGLMMSIEEFEKLPKSREAKDNAGYFIYVQFSPWCNIQKEIRKIQEEFHLSEEQISKNELLLSTMGQSRDMTILYLYLAAAVLAFLVAFAGVLMITGSLNSNVAQRTEFFGMLRCLGASKEQIIRYVKREALFWCRSAIPAGLLAGTIVIWILCAVLEALSPKYFFGMQNLNISSIGLLSGAVIGICTVKTAAKTPAKKAAASSPLMAVSGNKASGAPVRRAASTRIFKIDTALGLHHAAGSRKNFFLMTGSFALSIILFLAFTTMVDFMHHAVNGLQPYTPDLSIVSPDNTCSVDRELSEILREKEDVKRVYGRSFAYDIEVSAKKWQRRAHLISYEAFQFQWAKKDLIDGSLQEAMEGEGVLAVYNSDTPMKTGDVVTIDLGSGASGEGVLGEEASGSGTETLAICGTLSQCPFKAENGVELLICSEETFWKLTGQENYTIIDLQLQRNAKEQTVEEIRALAGETVQFSDQRMHNAEVKGAAYSFSLFIYGFLAVIALISTFNIINSIAMSVSARLKQYGAMRAVGMDSSQVLKMVASETASYGLFGMITGCLTGIPVNQFLYDKMITFRWGDAWQFPARSLAVIVLVMAFSLILAAYGPAKRIKQMSVADTIGSF